MTTEVEPSGVSIWSLGGANWGKNSALIDLENGSFANGRATIFVGDKTGSFTLGLRFISQGIGKSLTRSIKAPTGAYMVQVPGSKLRHTETKLGVGFRGHIYLVPRNVSFSRIKFREGTCKATATGFHKKYNGKIHDVSPEWATILSGNIETGCRVSNADRVDTGDHLPPFAWGTFRWPIPWQWRLEGKTTVRSFTTAVQYETAQASGTATIQKAKSGTFSREVNDETSGYY